MFAVTDGSYYVAKTERVSSLSSKQYSLFNCFSRYYMSLKVGFVSK
jgi:hypothetical protein